MLAVWALAALGQPAPPAKPRPAASKPAARSVRVPIAAGEAALKRDDLTARVNGASARVTRVSGPGDDLVLLFIFDMAGDLAVADAARQAIVEQIKVLSANVFVGVLRANDGLQVALDPTADREAAAAAVESVAVGGKAAFLDSIVTVSQLADVVAARSGVRTAVVYVTDSYVGNYREDFTNPVINESDYRDLSRRFPEGLIREKIRSIEEALAASQAPIFFVHVNQRSDRLSEAYQTGMTQLAQVSGGTGVFCRSTVEVPDAVQRIVDAAVGHHVAWVQVPQKIRKDVTVVVDAPGRVLSYRNRFVLK